MSAVNKFIVRNNGMVQVAKIAATIEIASKYGSVKINILKIVRECCLRSDMLECKLIIMQAQ
jgi:hypothetical protein